MPTPNTLPRPSARPVAATRLAWTSTRERDAARHAALARKVARGEACAHCGRKPGHPDC